MQKRKIISTWVVGVGGMVGGEWDKTNEISEMHTVNPCQFYAYCSFAHISPSAITSRNNNNYLHFKNHVEYFEQHLCKKLCASEGRNFNNCLDDLKRVRKHESRVVLNQGIVSGINGCQSQVGDKTML